MQLHLPYFLWDSYQYAVAAFKVLRIIYFISSAAGFPENPNLLK